MPLKIRPNRYFVFIAIAILLLASNITTFLDLPYLRPYVLAVITISLAASILVSILITFIWYKGYLTYDRLFISSIIFAISAVIANYFMDIPLRYGWGSDIYYYISVIESSSLSDYSVSTIMAVAKSFDHHYGPYIVFLSTIYSVFNIDSIALLYAAGIINFVLFIVFSYLFVKQETQSREVAVLSVVSFLYLWGPRYVWAGMYSVADAYNFFYPQGVGYTLLFLTLYLVSRAKEDIRSGILALLIAPLLILTHLQTGFLFFILIMIYIFIEPQGENIFLKIRFKAYLLLLMIFALFVSLNWPYYDFIRMMAYHIKGFYRYLILVAGLFVLIFFLKRRPELVYVGLLVVTGKFFLDSWDKYFGLKYFGLHSYIMVGGFSVIGILGLYQFLKSKKNFFFPIWFIVLYLIFSLGRLFPNPERFLFFSLIPLHVGAGFFIFNLLKTDSKIKFYLIALLVFTSVFSFGFKSIYIDIDNPIISFPFIEENTALDDIIISNFKDFRPISALTGRKTVYSIGSYVEEEEAMMREELVNAFFDNNTAPEFRDSIIKKYNVSFILLNKKLGHPDFNDTKVYEDDIYLLLKVEN